MIPVTDELRDAFTTARNAASNQTDGRCMPWDEAGIAAVLAIVERDRSDAPAHATGR